MKKETQTEMNMRNLPAEVQASYIPAEIVEMTEKALHKASIEMNENMEEIDSLPRMEAHRRRMEIMRKHMKQVAR